MKAYELWTRLINGFWEGLGEPAENYFGKLKTKRQMSEWRRLTGNTGGE